MIIKLTAYDTPTEEKHTTHHPQGVEVYLNSNQIIWFAASYSSTIIHLIDGKWMGVKETPAQVQALING